jgi:peptidylprolyl isomerase
MAIRYARFLFPAIRALTVCIILAATARMASAADANNSVGAADIVGQAGSITLHSSEVLALVASLPSQERAAVRGNLDSLERVVQGDLVQHAMLEDAKASAFDHQPGIAEQLDQLRDAALVRLWIANKAAVPTGYPSEADISAAYAANKQALAAPTEYRIAQIFISAPDGGDPAKLSSALHRAADIAAKITTSNFSQLAQQQSEDPQSASHGGDLGYEPENRLLPEILATIRTLAIGQVIGPIKTAQGLRFIRLIDKRPGAIPTLEQAHDGLAAALRSRRAAQMQQTYVASYSAKLGVAVNQIALTKLQQTLPR